MTKSYKLATVALGASLAALAVPTTASAAPTIDFFSPLTGLNFSNSQIGKQQVFDDVFIFTLKFARTVTDGYLYSEQTTLFDNVNFSNNNSGSNLTRVADTSGTPPKPCKSKKCTVYSFDILQTGVVEERAILNPFILQAGTYAVQIHGSSQKDGNYTGFLTFGGVPEPTTWALTIVGMGAVGFAMRRRKAVVSRVSFG